MNLPNKLSVIRICLVPLFVVFLLCRFPFHYGLSLIVFVVASLTDLLDGKIARQRGLVTTFGKFIDPLADKMLVVSALIGFVGIGVTKSWIVIIIILREFLVTSIRLVAAGQGTVIAANKWGKAKTVSQMAAIIYILAVETVWDITTSLPEFFSADLMGNALMIISCILTVISGAIYLRDNIDCLKETK